MDGVGNKSALDALPAVLDLDVAGPHQLEDVPRQIYERLMSEKQKSDCDGSEILCCLFNTSEVYMSKRNMGLVELHRM